MLSIKTESGHFPITGQTNYFIDHDEEGEKTLSFDLSVNNKIYSSIRLESRIETDDNIYLVKSINQRTTSSTIQCSLNLDDWRDGHFIKTSDIKEFQTKTIGNILEFIKPDDWIIDGKEVRNIKRTPDLEKCNKYDILMRCKILFDVWYEFDVINKIITIVDPYDIEDTGVYITPELNLKQTAYQGNSNNLVTRLYCYGAEDMTFSSINDGKPYVERLDYKGKTISASWSDQRYTNVESLLEDGKKKLNEMALPSDSFTLTVTDLASIDAKYSNLQLNLRSMVHAIIDPDRKISIDHRVVKLRTYPDEPNRNVVTLSSKPHTISNDISGLLENVETAVKDGIRNESEIAQSNKEIKLIAKATEEATEKVKSVEESITPENLMVTISDAINEGNSLKTVKIIMDILGLTVKGGGIKVYDAEDNLAMYIDDKTKKLTVTGDIVGANIRTDKDIYVGDKIIMGQEHAISGLYKTIQFGKNACLLGSVDTNDYSQMIMNGYDSVAMYTGPLKGANDDVGAFSAIGGAVRIQAGWTLTFNRQPTISSDMRKKKNIKDIDVSWIDELKVKQFEYKDYSGLQIGLMAQDYFDTEYSGLFLTEDVEGNYGIQYGNITNALIKYCQELKQEIDQLKKKVNG